MERTKRLWSSNKSDYSANSKRRAQSKSTTLVGGASDRARPPLLHYRRHYKRAAKRFKFFSNFCSYRIFGIFRASDLCRGLCHVLVLLLDGDFDVPDAHGMCCCDRFPH